MKSLLQSRTHTLGKIRHHTRSVYQLKTEMQELKMSMLEKKQYVCQVSTVLNFQKEHIASYFEDTPTELIPTPPVHLVQTFADIERRMEDVEETQWELHEMERAYAHRLYRLQQMHHRLVLLMQSVESLQKEGWDIDLTPGYQAIQDTTVPFEDFGLDLNTTPL